MSWKHQDAFQVNTSFRSSQREIPETPYKQMIDKEMSFRKLETEILQADMIESSLLLINNKDMMVTSNRINIHTPENSINVPAAGAIKINNACKIDSNNVHITGNLLLDNGFNAAMMLHTVKRIPMEDQNSFFLEPSNFTESNHFLLDCSNESTAAKGFLIMPPYKEYASEWSPTNLEYTYIAHLYINAHKDAMVDIDIIMKEQDTTVKMHSRNSSLSLMWLPQGKWIIHSIGYKTSIVSDK